MTKESFVRALRLFSERTPFRAYLIEFFSGDRVSVRHPEAIEPSGDLFLFRMPDRENRVFEADAVAQFIDPAPKQEPS